VISGWLEAVDRFQARGWVVDRDDPAGHVRLEFLLHDRRIGTAVADIYRPDLVNDGVGEGDHGFIFNFPAPLTDNDVHEVEVRARASNGTRVDLQRLLPAQQPATVTADPASGAVESAFQTHFPGLSVDPEQYPVFILGAARSGTSAMASGLMQTRRYVGYGKGTYSICWHTDGAAAPILRPQVRRYPSRPEHHDRACADGVHAARLEPHICSGDPAALWHRLLARQDP
jgi:hypothetical protein